MNTASGNWNDSLGGVGASWQAASVAHSPTSAPKRRIGLVLQQLAQFGVELIVVFNILGRVAKQPVAQVACPAARRP
jgi:hypothetical protein